MSATTDEPLRAGLHGMWASVAPGWAEHADFVDARSAELAAAMLDHAAPRSTDRLLELACGAGGLGLAAADRAGEVVLSDVAEPMTAIAAERARARGLANVGVRVLDLEAIDAPDASFDVVLCREGLQFATDHGRAAAEIARILRPGGRAALATWGPRERNPWLGLVLDAASEQMGHPVPPPGVPGPFSLSDADELRDVLTSAGLDVSVTEVDVPMRVGSVDEWWTRTVALAGPLAMLPDDAKAQIRAHAQEAALPYGLTFPGVSLLAAARKP